MIPSAALSNNCPPSPMATDIANFILGEGVRQTLADLRAHPGEEEGYNQSAEAAHLHPDIYDGCSSDLLFGKEASEECDNQGGYDGAAGALSSTTFQPNPSLHQYTGFLGELWQSILQVTEADAAVAAAQDSSSRNNNTSFPCQNQRKLLAYMPTAVPLVLSINFLRLTNQSPSAA